MGKYVVITKKPVFAQFSYYQLKVNDYIGQRSEVQYKSDFIKNILFLFYNNIFTNLFNKVPAGIFPTNF